MNVLGINSGVSEIDEHRGPADINCVVSTGLWRAVKWRLGARALAWRYERVMYVRTPCGSNTVGPVSRVSPRKSAAGICSGNSPSRKVRL